MLSLWFHVIMWSIVFLCFCHIYCVQDKWTGALIICCITEFCYIIQTEVRFPCNILISHHLSSPKDIPCTGAPVHHLGMYKEHLDPLEKTDSDILLEPKNCWFILAVNYYSCCSSKYCTWCQCQPANPFKGTVVMLRGKKGSNHSLGCLFIQWLL